jgi:hypothetical protein
MRNSSTSNYSSELADSDIEPERHDSIARLIESNKMRRLMDAKQSWAKNHGSNSPFRMNYSSNFSCSSDNASSNQVKLSNIKESMTCDSPSVKNTSTFSKFNKGVEMPQSKLKVETAVASCFKKN